MTRDDVIRMATSANILEPLGYECPHRKSWRDDIVRGLERFAAIVASREREECAKVCLFLSDVGMGLHDPDDHDKGVIKASQVLADLIRRREPKR